MIDIGKDIKVMYQDFKKKDYVTIRRWYKDADGKEQPGKQGINLKWEEWEEFLNKLEAVKNDLTESKNANKKD